MKFTCEVNINRPLEETFELFMHPQTPYKCQPGLKSMILISGEKGQEGSETKLLYEMGRRKMELHETIIKIDPPHVMGGQYEHSSMSNTMYNYFSAIDKNTTKYQAEVHYTRFSGLVPKLMAFFFPKMFRKQVQSWMELFKKYAEK